MVDRLSCLSILNLAYRKDDLKLHLLTCHFCCLLKADDEASVRGTRALAQGKFLLNTHGGTLTVERTM